VPKADARLEGGVDDTLRDELRTLVAALADAVREREASAVAAA
jgi:hypothetical protein